MQKKLSEIRIVDWQHIDIYRRMVSDKMSSIIQAVPNAMIIKHLLVSQKAIRIINMWKQLFEIYGKELGFKTIRKFIVAEVKYMFK